MLLVAKDRQLKDTAVTIRKLLFAQVNERETISMISVKSSIYKIIYSSISLTIVTFLFLKEYSTNEEFNAFEECCNDNKNDLRTRMKCAAIRIDCRKNTKIGKYKT